MTDDSVTQRPEGQLLERVQQRLKAEGVSQRKLAERAGMSEGRWRQIVKGYQSAGGGQIPVVAPAETLARMAMAAGLSPDRLAAVGRTDAADLMESGPSKVDFTWAPREFAEVFLAADRQLFSHISTEKILTELTLRARELEERIAQLEGRGDAAVAMPTDLAARTTGRVGGAAKARSSQDADAEDPGV